jgi:hypothetical protein
MPNLNQLAFDLPQNATWIAVGVGVLLTLLVLAVGYLLVDRRETAKLIPRPASAAAPSTASGRASHPQYDPFVDGSALERRTALRRKGNPVLVHISDAEAKAKPTTGWVMDRSTTGLCLQVEEAMAVRTILCVRAGDAPKGTIWIQIEVKNCRQKGNSWEIGCEFVQPPPWGIMLLFG